MNDGAANLVIRMSFGTNTRELIPYPIFRPQRTIVRKGMLPIRTLVAATTQGRPSGRRNRDTGDMMIKLIVRGRTWWMVRGCLYGNLVDAIAARDA